MIISKHLTSDQEERQIKRAWTGATSGCSYSISSSLLFISGGSGYLFTNKRVIHVGTCATMVACEQRRTEGVIYWPPLMFVSHQAMHGWIFRSQSSRQRQTRPWAQRPAAAIACFDYRLPSTYKNDRFATRPYNIRLLELMFIMS